MSQRELRSKLPSSLQCVVQLPINYSGSLKSIPAKASQHGKARRQSTQAAGSSNTKKTAGTKVRANNSAALIWA